MTSIRKPQELPPSYAERLGERLRALEQQLVDVVESSTILNIDPNRHGSGINFIGAVRWGWGKSDGEHEHLRMRALQDLREAEPLLRLLFPHPVARIKKQLDEFFKLARNWLLREKTSHSVPSNVKSAVVKISEEFEGIKELLAGLPPDSDSVRLVVDTNALIDCPDLAIYVEQIGRRYRAHLMPVVLGELDDLKRSGRTPELREAAAKAVKRLKGLRANGDPLAGVRAAGEVFAVFEHIEPSGDDLPSWINLDVPDDRFVASTLLLQSAHPGSSIYAATGDINLQNKLSAVGIPFVEVPDE